METSGEGGIRVFLGFFFCLFRGFLQFLGSV